MADLAETRKFCVQSLRKCGKLCGVPLIRDNSSREKVDELAEAIQESGGPAEQKTAAARSYEAYQATWPAESDDDDDDDDEEEEEGQEGTDEEGAAPKALDSEAGVFC